MISQPGNIKFISTDGNDANTGTIASRLRHFQTYNGTTFGGFCFGPSAVGNASDHIRPGSTGYALEGDYGADASFENRLVNLFRKTGLNPTGANNTGPLTFSRYPGAAWANAPHVVQWIGVSGTNGGFQGCDTDRSDDTTYYGTTGYCQYINICHFKITSHPGSAGDGAPVNRQTGSNYWRVINNELEWRCTTGSPTAGGVAGEGSWSRLLGNDVHDIYDPSGSQQNHGFYNGNNSNATGDARGDYHGEYAYNVFTNIQGGQCIMTRGLLASTPADSAPYTSVHHNWCEGWGKYGLEFLDGRLFGFIYHNLCYGSATSPAGIYTDVDGLTTTGGILVAFNSCIGWSLYAGMYQHGSGGAGSVRYEGNLICQLSGYPNTDFDLFLSFGQNATWNKNLWMDLSTGGGVKPAGDSTGVTADPQFVSIAAKDFRPTASAAKNFANMPVTANIPNRDLLGRVRPTDPDTKWSAGCLEAA
jgi:hypothetical protein